MDVRIGVTDTPRELVVALSDETDPEALRADVDAALSGSAPSLWLTDTKGSRVGISSARLAYVEIGPAAAHPIGFG